MAGPMNTGKGPPPRCLPDPPFFENMGPQFKFDFCVSAFQDLAATHDESASGMTLAWVLKAVVMEIDDALADDVDAKRLFVSRVGMHPWLQVNPFHIRIQPSTSRMYLSKQTRWKGPVQAPPATAADQAALGRLALAAARIEAPSAAADPAAIGRLALAAAGITAPVSNPEAFGRMALAAAAVKALRPGLLTPSGGREALSRLPGQPTPPAAIAGSASALLMPAAKRPRLGACSAPTLAFTAPASAAAAAPVPSGSWEGDEPPGPACPRQLPDASVFDFERSSVHQLIDVCAGTVEELFGSHDEASTGCSMAQMVRSLVAEVDELFGADFEHKRTFAQRVTSLPWFRENAKCVRVNANANGGVGRVYVSNRTRVITNQGGRAQFTKPNVFGQGDSKGYGKGLGSKGGYGQPARTPIQIPWSWPEPSPKPSAWLSYLKP